ncbi:MAG: ATP-dependent DNA helicase RecG [Deltaproteobacteria bacterium]|nr:ATP-dependent DNA helicase RecG [Deltaproteobacteria bacterium]
MKGIGPKRAELLAEKGLHTLLDLLLFTPISYEDRRKVMVLSEAMEGLQALVKGKVVSGREERFFRSRKRLFKITIRDETGDLDLIWFRYNKAHLNSFAHKDLEITAYGKIQKNRGKMQMLHPDISSVDEGGEGRAHGFYPVYSYIKGISGQILRSLIRAVIHQNEGNLKDGIPNEVTGRLNLPQLGEAIRHVHIPPKGSSIDQLNRLETKYHKRLTFDRFFLAMLSIAYRKKTREKRIAPAFRIPKDLIERVQKSVPFVLTHDQKKVIQEIFQDLGRDRPMNRLLQGDVGCGKTVVAAAASSAAVLSDWQVAVMAPTQVLARQHYLYFSSLSEKLGFRPVLLTGGIKKSDRLAANEKIEKGEYNLIIGTHALIQENLSFEKLGFVIIDEQHRFGVRQRAMLDRKGNNPHLLVMTATPIPRTLAMTVYADLDISSIREYPQGHQTVRTHLVDKNQKRKVFNTIREKMLAGEQAIVICPLIEESEDLDLKNVLQMHEKLTALFSPRFQVGLIHGRLSADEKDRVMEHFRDGIINLLVGTTVIEVGVHAPEATVMVIEHPERFGLSQLHQLRGRVGRGKRRGLCLLMASRGLKEESLSRLKILAENHDGFLIAQKDLEIRGQGKLMGTLQTGTGEIDFMEAFREPKLLITSKKEAERVIESDPELLRPENRNLRQMVEPAPASLTDF